MVWEDLVRNSDCQPTLGCQYDTSSCSQSPVYLNPIDIDRFHLQRL